MASMRLWLCWQVEMPEGFDYFHELIVNDELARCGDMFLVGMPGQNGHDMGMYREWSCM